MSTQEADGRLELLQGTLDLLILRTLIFGSQHGQGIAARFNKHPKKNCESNTGRSIPRCSGWKSGARYPPNGGLLPTTEKRAFTR